MRNVEIFKNELRNYLTYKKTYTKKINKLNEEIEYLYYLLSGLSGKGFDGTSGSTNQEAKEERKLELIEKVNDLQNKKTFYKEQIDSIEKVLNKTQYKNILIRIYCKKETYEKVGTEIGYSSRGLQKRIDKELEKILANYE